MPLKSGTSKKTLADNIRELVRAGYEKAQAAAIAYDKQRKHKKKEKK